MKSHPRWLIFSLAACTAYTLAYYFDWSLFQYDLSDNSFHFLSGEQAAGPPILWYGWLGTAVLAGGFFALLAHPVWTAKLSPDLIWLVPAVLIVAALFYEKRWFM